MEIRGSKDGLFILTPLFGSLDPNGILENLLCDCAVSAGRFSGATESGEPIVIIGIPALRHFVDDLGVVERDRRGEADLISRSLSLKVYIYDRPGHARFSVDLSDNRPEGKSQVSVTFELDPTQLPAILSDFEDLLMFPHQRPLPDKSFSA